VIESNRKHLLLTTLPARYRFQPRLLTTLAAAAAIALTLALANWQLGRAHEKEAAATRLELRAKDPPLRLTAAEVKSRDAEWRRVTARGRFDPAHAVLIDNRVRGGVAGYHVVMPLALAGSIASFAGAVVGLSLPAETLYVALGLVIIATGWTLADVIAGALIALFILPRTWALLRQAVNVLLEGAPPHLDVTEIEDALRSAPAVRRVHDLHVWTLTSGREAMSAHVVVEAGAPTDRILEELHLVLHARFGIDHTTIQIETEPAPLIQITPRAG